MYGKGFRRLVAERGRQRDAHTGAPPGREGARVVGQRRVPSDVRTHLNAPGMTPNERSQRLLRRCFAHYQGQDWSDSFQESVIEPPEATCLNAMPVTLHPRGSLRDAFASRLKSARLVVIRPRVSTW